jgi:hypothetical protein
LDPRGFAREEIPRLTQQHRESDLLGWAIEPETIPDRGPETGACGANIVKHSSHLPREGPPRRRLGPANFPAFSGF